MTFTSEMVRVVVVTATEITLANDPANDAAPPVAPFVVEDVDAELARDADFEAVCDARREAWTEALDNETAEAPRLAGGTDDE